MRHNVFLLSLSYNILAAVYGKVVDIVTRIDLVRYWNEMRSK